MNTDRIVDVLARGTRKEKIPGHTLCVKYKFFMNVLDHLLRWKTLEVKAVSTAQLCRALCIWGYPHTIVS